MHGVKLRSGSSNTPVIPASSFTSISIAVLLMRINIAAEKTMDWQISNRPNDNGESKSMSTGISVDFGEYARKSVELEARRHGDQMNAIDTVARRLGMGARAVRRMMNGERKTFTPALIGRLRQAYLETLQRQLASSRSRSRRK